MVLPRHNRVAVYHNNRDLRLETWPLPLVREGELLLEVHASGICGSDVHGFDDALMYAATNQYLEARRESHKLLRARGVFVDDCLSDELPAAITSRYLAIKRAGLL